MRILLTGGSGMVGRALLRCAAGRDGIELVAPTRSDYDLSDTRATAAMIRDIAPEAVIHGAARVGGIHANVADPAGFLVDNMAVALNTIDAARKGGVRRLIYLGSSCMYPKDLERPLREEDVLTAPLEPTNEGYALAKIAGARLATYIARQDGLAYRTVIPSNLYGPGDSFDPQRSHLVAAVIAKTVAAVRDHAASIEIWGDGMARREFLYVDDLAGFVLDHIVHSERLPDMINVGAGGDHSVNDYYRVVADLAGFRGEFRHDLARPTGMKQKLMDSTKAQALGWRPATDLRAGLQKTIAFYEAGTP